MLNKLVYLSSAAVLFTLLITGCQEEKKEAPQGDATEKEVQQDTAAVQNEQKADSIAAKEQAEIPDITGTWTGRFDNHSTVLNITEQDSLNFKGKITINYREVINQEVSGKFNPEEKTLTMKDLLHSRYQGTYAAKLSEDLQSFAGTFTMTVDKSKFKFNLKKK